MDPNKLHALPSAGIVEDRKLREAHVRARKEARGKRFRAALQKINAAAQKQAPNILACDLAGLAIHHSFQAPLHDHVEHADMKDEDIQGHVERLLANYRKSGNWISK